MESMHSAEMQLEKILLSCLCSFRILITAFIPSSSTNILSAALMSLTFSFDFLMIVKERCSITRNLFVDLTKLSQMILFVLYFSNSLMNIKKLPLLINDAIISPAVSDDVTILMMTVLAPLHSSLFSIFFLVTPTTSSVTSL